MKLILFEDALNCYRFNIIEDDGKIIACSTKCYFSPILSLLLINMIKKSFRDNTNNYTFDYYSDFAGKKRWKIISNITNAVVMTSKDGYDNTVDMMDDVVKITNFISIMELKYK